MSGIDAATPSHLRLSPSLSAQDLILELMPTPLAFELPAFFLGPLFGSFLNVCISRLPDHRSLSHPRSHCPLCSHTIAWYDNVPLLSWIFLLARCRHCQQPISWRYPAVELAFALWLTFAARTAFPLLKPGISTNVFAATTIDALAFAILGFLLIGLLVMDWQTHTLPDAFTLTGTLLGFLLLCVRAAYLPPHQYDLLLHGHNPLTSVGGAVDNGNVILTGSEHLVLGRILGIALAAGLLLLIRFAYKALRHREGLGLGDIKLVAMITAFLGFWLAAFAIFLGVLLCASYALILLARRRATATTRLPLGSFLAIGGLVAAILGAPVIAWYSSLF
jgi:leader peptidase (prepilin peptidase)/N-methyltransferase